VDVSDDVSEQKKNLLGYAACSPSMDIAVL
jgi:hypothetical protein